MGIFSLKLQGTLPPLSEQPKHWDDKNWAHLSKTIAECLSSPSIRPTANGLKDVFEELSKNIKINQKERNSASQDTMSISSSFESGPDFDLLIENDEYEIED